MNNDISDINAQDGNASSEFNSFEFDGKILLAEVPEPPKRTVIQAPPPSRVQTPLAPIHTVPDEPETPHTVRFVKIRKFVGRGFFDPFHAFYEDLNAPRFRSAQLFLSALALAGPILFFGISSILAALVYQVLAAINSVTLPNPFYELACYPMAYIIVKGYWLAYLILPVVALLLGWTWAAASALALARGSEHSFKQYFFIMAMVGTMFAPFTLFPFLRLVALLILGIYTFRKMSQYFGVGFLHMAVRAGIFFLITSISYAWIEQKVESFYPMSTELTKTLQDYYFKQKPLEWPSFSHKAPASPCQDILKNLGSLDPAVRDKASISALNILALSRETPEVRFQLAQQLARNGKAEGMIYLSQAYRTGLGTAVNLPAALDWIQQANHIQPDQLETSLAEAHLLCLNNRRLEGKHLFVATAKNDIRNLDKINTFLANNGYGMPAGSLVWAISGLYKPNGSDYASYSGNRRHYGSTYDESDRLRDQKLDIMERIAENDHNGNQWFYRALVTEYKASTYADPEIYGEPRPTANELLNANSSNPEALDIAGDKAESLGDHALARECWRKAANALNNDNRKPNAHFYFKLAKSFDPENLPAPVGNAKEAARYYLAFLLMGESTNAQSRTAQDALRRLGIQLGQDYDFMSPKFVSLCTKYDIPEAWAILGSYYAGGSVSGFPKNQAKAQDCFQKAVSFGYQGPVVHMYDASKSN